MYVRILVKVTYLYNGEMTLNFDTTARTKIDKIYHNKKLQNDVVFIAELQNEHKIGTGTMKIPCDCKKKRTTWLPAREWQTRSGRECTNSRVKSVGKRELQFCVFMAQCPFASRSVDQGWKI